MDVVHLNQKQLAARWRRSEACLERWRSDGIGPKFLKLCGRVLYRQADIEAFEASCLNQDRFGTRQGRLTDVPFRLHLSWSDDDLEHDRFSTATASSKNSPKRR